jgi:hypothetical protein
LFEFVSADRRRPFVLVELGVMEQRLQAMKEVLDGASVTDVARRNKVARQTAHDWLRRYAAHGLAGLIDTTVNDHPCLLGGGIAGDQASDNLGEAGHRDEVI